MASHELRRPGGGHSFAVATFAAPGVAVATVVDPEVKVVVWGNPVNTNSPIAESNPAGSVLRHITAMSRLD